MAEFNKDDDNVFEWPDESRVLLLDRLAEHGVLKCAGNYNQTEDSEYVYLRCTNCGVDVLAIEKRKDPENETTSDTEERSND